MITCPSCHTELPAAAAFCHSCGRPIAHEVDPKAPSEVDRDWLIAIFTSDGYKCEENKAQSAG